MSFLENMNFFVPSRTKSSRKAMNHSRRGSSECILLGCGMVCVMDLSYWRSELSNTSFLI